MSYEEPRTKKEAKMKVKPGQIWKDQTGKRVLVMETKKGWVRVLNEYGTMESYAISKGTRDESFHGYFYVKLYETTADFPSAFKNT